MRAAVPMISMARVHCIFESPPAICDVILTNSVTNTAWASSLLTASNETPNLYAILLLHYEGGVNCVQHSVPLIVPSHTKHKLGGTSYRSYAEAFESFLEEVIERETYQGVAPLDQLRAEVLSVGQKFSQQSLFAGSCRCRAFYDELENQGVSLTSEEQDHRTGRVLE